MEKIYKVRISFGDGNPIEDTVVARSGMLAQDIAMRAHPGARNIHLIGVDNRYESHKPVPAPSEPSMLHHEEPYNFFENADRDTQIRCCIQMRAEGKSQRAIAGYLGIAKSTVSRWIKQYG